ncbi:MAG: hypothetical protein FWD71_08430 [Oscillospiraceae bacterium]|nr:hypothetical protein [Oscillospiraceae bacterium]
MEIERKFLINNFPNNLTCIKTAIVSQGYVSIIPEVRIRSYEYDNNSKEYVLTIKGDGNLSRNEIEICIDEKTFNEILEIIAKPLIKKDYRKYQLPDGLMLECSQVDKDSATEFMYAEIEFENEKQAKTFIVLDFLGKEITNCPEYKMKNYWNHTRNL